MNKISYLIDDSGDHVESHEGICNVVHNYFEGIFTGKVFEKNVAQVICPRSISDEQNASLVKEITFDEFTVTVKQMHPDKASGPDGLNPDFFQTFWSSLGHEVFAYCKEWLHLNSFPHELNNTNVVLIPKK